MKKQISKKPVALAMGAALTGGMMVAGGANAAENPFGLSELGNGYMQVAAAHMEGKCGASHAKESEGKCGGQPAAKPAEGKCGGQPAPKAAEGKCGGSAPAKKTEGSCGEGKCGGSMR